MYLSLTQSNADEDKLVGSIHPSQTSQTPQTPMYPTGTVDVGAGTALNLAQPFAEFGDGRRAIRRLARHCSFDGGRNLIGKPLLT